jgi:hypothetical protein
MRLIGNPDRGQFTGSVQLGEVERAAPVSVAAMNAYSGAINYMLGPDVQRGSVKHSSAGAIHAMGALQRPVAAIPPLTTAASSDISSHRRTV